MNKTGVVFSFISFHGGSGGGSACQFPVIFFLGAFDFPQQRIYMRPTLEHGIQKKEEEERTKDGASNCRCLGQP